MKVTSKQIYLIGAGVLLVILLIIFVNKIFADRNLPDNLLVDDVKAESFKPASQPTISTDEKVIGSTGAAVKMVVYEDYSNIFSADNSANIKQLEEDFGSKIVVAVRPYATREKPLSLEAAMAVECAAEQDKWSEMRDGIFRAVKSDSLNSDGIIGWAKQINLDEEKFNQCLTDVKKQGIMLQVAVDAQQFSVYGAPTIFINNELIVGARPYEDYVSEDGEKIAGLKSLISQYLK